MALPVCRWWITLVIVLWLNIAKINQLGVCVLMNYLVQFKDEIKGKHKSYMVLLGLRTAQVKYKQIGLLIQRFAKSCQSLTESQSQMFRLQILSTGHWKGMSRRAHALLQVPQVFHKHNDEHKEPEQKYGSVYIMFNNEKSRSWLSLVRMQVMNGQDPRYGAQRY